MRPSRRKSRRCPRTCGRGLRASPCSSSKKAWGLWGEPHVKHIESRLWEMRLQGRSGISRALYVTAVARRVVILRLFIKKTEKTPRREIDLALSRARLIKETEK